MKLLHALFLFVLLGGVCEVRARVIESIEVHYLKELINGITFEHRLNLVNGITKEHWLIDAKEVNVEEYEHALVQAELEQRRQERQADLAHKKQLFERKAHSQHLVQRRLLQEYLQTLEHTLALLDEYTLRDSIAFNDTFSAQDFNELVTILLPRMRTIVHADQAGCSFNEADELLHKVEPLTCTIQSVFHDTIDHATKICKDTRTLKKLLELTTQL